MFLEWSSSGIYNVKQGNGGENTNQEGSNFRKRSENAATFTNGRQIKIYAPS